MAALPGGAHAAGAADPMQVDQPRPAAAAAATAPADAKVSDSPPPRAGGSGGQERLRRGRRISLSEPTFVFFPLLLSGGSRVRSARRSAPRAARVGGVAASPHRSRAIPPLAIREVEVEARCLPGRTCTAFLPSGLCVRAMQASRRLLPQTGWLGMLVWGTFASFSSCTA